jgi:hypothetical protein
MWGVLWNIWYRGHKTKVVKELDFAWSSSSIQDLESKTIFHNAGITGTTMDNHLCFYKGKYHMGADPTKDTVLDEIINSEESQKFCTWYYAKKLKELGEKYKINY